MSAQKKRNFQIEAYKHRVVVDPNYAEKTWMILEHAIKEIYNQNASGLSFEELYSWHHKAMLFEQYHWKRALKKGQPYKFKLNEYMDKDHRDAYYINWPVYFP